MASPGANKTIYEKCACDTAPQPLPNVGRRKKSKQGFGCSQRWRGAFCVAKVGIGDRERMVFVEKLCMFQILTGNRL